MKRAIVVLMGVLLVCLLPGLVGAVELGPLAVRAMELSGARESLEGLPKALEEQVAGDPRTKKLNKKQRAELANILKPVLDSRTLVDGLTNALVATGDEGRLGQAVAIMDSPVFQKVTKQSMKESAVATAKDMSDYAKGLEKKPPDAERVRLLQRLDAATDGAAILADISYTSAAQFLAAAPMSPSERAAQLEQLRARLEVSSPNEFLIRNLYALRKVELKDLEAYVAAHEQESMGWLARHLGYGMRDLMEGAVARMVASMEAVSARKP